MKRLASMLQVLALALCATAPAQAESMVVTGQLKAGLHEEKSLDSPVVKLVTTGTALEVIKREDPLSFVREPGGTSGWIDNSYLGTDAPTASGQLKGALDRGDALERRLAEAQQQIADLGSGKGAPAAQPGGESQRYETLKKQNADTEQQLKQERLNVGELQAQLAELKKRLGVSNDNDSLYQRIQELEGEKKRLEVLLSSATEGGTPAAPNARISAASGITVPAGNLATGLIIALIAGLLAGIYFMDYLNRRRHGGFRV